MPSIAVRRPLPAIALGAVVLACALSPARAEAIAPTGTSTNTSEGTTIALTRPAGAQVGDVMIMSVAATVSGTAITTPAGWTSIGNTPNGGNTIRMRTFWRRSTAADPSSWTVTLNTTRSTAGAIASYSGIDTVTTFDANLSATSGNSGTASANSLTASELGSMLVIPVAFQVSGGVAGTPSGTTRRLGDASASVALALGDEVRVNSGATGARTGVSFPANSGWVAHPLLLQAEPELTATFPAAYAWGGWAIGTNTSAEQALTVTSNRSWGVKLSTDHADGRMTEWNGALPYLSRKVGSAIQWRLSTLGGVPQSTSFASASSTPSLVTTTQAKSPTAVSVGVSFRQTISYADDAALGPNVYRTEITYDAAQGF